MSPVDLLGVDGGGTSTAAWLADADGHVLGRGLGGPSNIKAIGAEAARAGLEGAIRAAFEDAGRDPSPIAAACLGLAGFDRPEDKGWLEQWASGMPWAGRSIFVNDGDLVIAAGTPGGWGVGVIAGTGSIAVGRGPDGRSARSGGWGYLIGDEGSGYAVALAGLRRVARLADGRAPGRSGSDPLTARLCEALGIDGPSGMVGAVYREGRDRARIAALAPAVVAAAGEDPAIVDEILGPAGRELARMVDAAARGIGAGPVPLPLAMAGSFLLNSPVVSAAMLRWLAEAGHEVRATPVPDPVRGALILAREVLQS